MGISCQEYHYRKISIKKTIKSVYILKCIFSFLSEKKEKEVIIYSKKLQKIFEININDYIKESGKYKEAKKNGIVKEFLLNTNSLTFEGEYKNGKKHGKGKEYYKNGCVKFEGEYINGKKTKGKGYDKQGNLILEIDKDGKGKEYFDNKNLQFTGIYLNGKRWNGIGYNYNGLKEFEIKLGKGKGKEYYYNGEIKFEGEYLNGLRHGLGKKYKGNNKLEFEGEYLNGKKSGKGKEYYDGHPIYEGEFKYGERNGHGVYYDGNLSFEGEFKDGNIYNGEGTEYDNFGRILFKGTYKSGFKLDENDNESIVKL